MKWYLSYDSVVIYSIIDFYSLYCALDLCGLFIYLIYLFLIFNSYMRSQTGGFMCGLFITHYKFVYLNAVGLILPSLGNYFYSFLIGLTLFFF